MIFFSLYIVLSIFLAYLCSLLFKSNMNKALIFSFIFSFFGSLWFREPGSDEIAPIISIFLLEMSILESNGLERIVRPFIFSFVVSFAGYFFIKKLFLKFKNLDF